MTGTSSYFRILVSYLAILVVPMVTLTVIGYSMASRAGYRETVRHNMELVQRVRTAVDREIAHVTAIAYAIDRDFEIRHPRAFGEPLDVMSIQRRFGSYVSTNQFIRDVVYVTRGADRYIGATSVFSPTGLLFAYARRDVIDGYRLNQTLESVRRPGFILLRETIEAGGPFAFYAHPIGLRTDRPAVVVFVIPTERLIGVVTGVASTASLPSASTASAAPGSVATNTAESGHFVIVDPYGAVVMSHPPIDRRVLDLVRAHSAAAAPQTGSSDAGRYIVTSSTSPESGWSTALVTPVDVATRIMRDEFRGLLIVVIILVLVEIVLLEFFIRWNYRPVSVLLQDLEHPDQPNEIRDGSLPIELSAIHRALQEAHRSSERSKMTNRLFGLLGRAGGYDPVAVADLLTRLGMSGKGSGYRAIVVRAPSPSRADGTTEEAAIALFAGHVDAVGILDTDHSALSVLVTEPDLPIERTCESLYAGLSAAFGGTICIGLGPRALRVDGLSASLDAAAEAAERGLLLGNTPMVAWGCVDAMREATSIARLSGWLHDSLEQIRRDSAEEAGRVIRSILDATAMEIGVGLTSSGARTVANGVVYEVVARTTRLAMLPVASEALALVRRALELADAVNAGLIALPRLASALEELLAPTAALESAERSRARVVEGHASRVTELVDYVNEHLLEQSFSLTDVAGSLGMSVSSASSLFKERVGQRLSDYVGDRRIAEAKRLLDEGTPVNEVVDRVGYLDPTSFIKKFKKCTGVTPGEWPRR